MPGRKVLSKTTASQLPASVLLVLLAMSVLPRATGVTINGGNFVAVSNGESKGSGSLKDIIPLLLSHSATAGLLDAEERFDAPKCDEGTRVSMLREMKHFVQQPVGGPSIYWLHGPAGVGKSALAQSLALSLQEDGDHAASFFFSRTAQGRSDGNRLFATLACQLALNIPALQPILTKVVKDNPIIFYATNSTKMQRLIVEPLNQLHKSFRWNPRVLARRLAKRKLHPRLILVDGLDECSDPRVQQDLLICIGNAIRELSLPFRFIITSRPESHILATFEHDPIYQGPRGVKLTTKNLGDDEDADGQITTFLLKEFAEIRRTHPIRDFLPAQWPLPGQIGQLVAKSSKGFIYPATVIRYIKLPNNRPDKCLERVLGLSKIPAQDKPYEPIDVLYRYIFESIPAANKEAVRSIFYLLLVWSPLIRTDPEHLDSYLKFEAGHVQHVLRDLQCIVSFTQKEPIGILHASLPDFLLDPSRSGPLSIDLGDAHATVVASVHDTFLSGYRLQQSKHFGAFLDHLMQANMTSGLLGVLIKFDLKAEYATFCKRLDDPPRHQEEMFSAITSVIAYLRVLVHKDLPTPYIVGHIDALMDYCIQRYPLALAFRALVNDIGLNLIPNEICYPVLNEQPIFEEIFGLNLSRVELSNNISTLHLMLLSGIFSSYGEKMIDAAEISEVEYRLRKGISSSMHTQIARALLPFLMPDLSNESKPYETGFLRPIALQITLFCLQRAVYSVHFGTQLEQFLTVYNHAVEFYASQFQRTMGTLMISDLQQLATAILDFLNTSHRSAPANARQ